MAERLIAQPKMFVMNPPKTKSVTMEKEIEEAAANLADPRLSKTDNWIAGAKWQAERVYTKGWVDGFNSGKEEAERMQLEEGLIYTEDQLREAFLIGLLEEPTGFEEVLKQIKEKP